MLRIIITIATSFLLVPSVYASDLDEDLKNIIQSEGLDQPFELDHKGNNEALIELGADLFFSPDLSVFESVSCASCHHPLKGGADGLVLPIGVSGGVSENVGDERLKHSIATYPDKGLMGLIPRNSPTVINSALYRKALFWDGRAQRVLGEDGKPGNKIKVGFGINDLSPRYYQQKSLLQAQARLPMASPFEMKGVAPSFLNDHEIEQQVVQNLQSIEFWCDRFKSVFKAKQCIENVSLDNLTLALAEYQASLLLVNSPFQQYIDGNTASLTKEQKQGAVLFYTSIEDGGLGCVSCHSGKNFSEESFYDLGVPVSGIGANGSGTDYGRANVDKNENKNKKSFRVPSLLNINETAPYFHNGAAKTLRDAIKYHALEEREKVELTLIDIEGYDFFLMRDRQRQAFERDKRSLQGFLKKSITDKEAHLVEQFLLSLSDDCFSDVQCLNDLVREPVKFLKHEMPLALPKQMRFKGYAVGRNKPSYSSVECSTSRKNGETQGLSFSTVASVTDEHREIGLIRRGSLMDIVNYSGVSAVDIDGDCLDDLVLDLGINGIRYLKQGKGGNFIEQSLNFQQNKDQLFTLVFDIDGDYKQDLLVGALGLEKPYIVFDFVNAKEKVYLDALSGPVINASVADVENDGDLDLAFAYWRTFKSLSQEHIWINKGNGKFDAQVNALAMRRGDKTVEFVGEGARRRNFDIPLGRQDLTFTPNFVDLDNDGDQDLLMAADFHRSQVFINQNGYFEDVTESRDNL